MKLKETVPFRLVVCKCGQWRDQSGSSLRLPRSGPHRLNFGSAIPDPRAGNVCIIIY